MKNENAAAAFLISDFGRSLRHRNCPEAVPQPSGGACDVEEQPSARGRLRAAGRTATEVTDKTLQPIVGGCGQLRLR